MVSVESDRHEVHTVRLAVHVHAVVLVDRVIALQRLQHCAWDDGHGVNIDRERIRDHLQSSSFSGITVERSPLMSFRKTILLIRVICLHAINNIFTHLQSLARHVLHKVAKFACLLRQSRYPCRHGLRLAAKLELRLLLDCGCERNGRIQPDELRQVVPDEPGRHGGVQSIDPVHEVLAGVDKHVGGVRTRRLPLLNLADFITRVPHVLGHLPIIRFFLEVAQHLVFAIVAQGASRSEAIGRVHERLACGPHHPVHARRPLPLLLLCLSLSNLDDLQVRGFHSLPNDVVDLQFAELVEPPGLHAGSRQQYDGDACWLAGACEAKKAWVGVAARRPFSSC
mmetsp:Transcript_66431/g.163752  ORF Transcript_66431/g.163752 Transcript_66431/m.163752 type:complete len:339 (-) Transcript_66431:34-1050(-)